MITKITSGALHGVAAFPVELEVDFSRQGLPAFTLVGLAEGAVREARDRVLSALRNSSLRIPPARITVNLAPADRKKGGTLYDLPLAIGLLTSAGLLPEHSAKDYFFAGELSLTGELRPITGILPLAVLARDMGVKGMLVSPANAKEASIVDGLQVYPVQTIGQAASFLSGEISIEPSTYDFSLDKQEALYSVLDFSDVKGQEHAKRAVEIASAGGHNLLFLGPPGSGKSMISQRMPTVLPPLSFEESLEVTKIYSVAGLLSGGQALVRERPFRSPHHSISEFGLVGGGAYPRPGEISLAHRGVLFLDELLEFRKQTLEVLRQPLEQGYITIARAALSLDYPADFMLVAAMNPCPCGYLTDSRKACTCSSSEIQRYRSRLSGPLLDRIDMHIEVPAVPYDDLTATGSAKSSSNMRDNINVAMKAQAKRYDGLPIRNNASLNGQSLEKFCKLDSAGQQFLRTAVTSLHLSARAYTRILRIARTIADLEEEENILTVHLAEAVNCRTLDREQF